MKFGKPLRCDRDDATCSACKIPIARGQPLLVQFPSRLPWCLDCAADAPRTNNDQNLANSTGIVEQLKRIADVCSAANSAQDPHQLGEKLVSIIARIEALEAKCADL